MRISGIHFWNLCYITDFIRQHGFDKVSIEYVDEEGELLITCKLNNISLYLSYFIKISDPNDTEQFIFGGWNDGNKVISYAGSDVKYLDIWYKKYFM